MPPQQTKLTPETGRDAAGRGPDLAIALAKDATGVLSLLAGYWRAFRKWRQRERLRVSLHELSERGLMDIGLTSSEIDHLDAGRALERLRDGMRYP